MRLWRVQFIVIQQMKRKSWGELSQRRWRTAVSEFQVIKNKQSYLFFFSFPVGHKRPFVILWRGGGRVISLKFSHWGFEVASMKKVTERPGIFLIPPSLGQQGLLVQSKVFIGHSSRETLHVLCNACTVHCSSTAAIGKWRR